MTDETYNGWKNRETWAFNLHWSSDQGLYGMVLECARGALEDIGSVDEDLTANGQAYELGRRVIEYLDEVFQELGEADPAHYVKNIVPLMRDVGSWWRIDELETGRSVLETLKEEE